MVKIQLELSEYYDKIIRNLILKGKHKTKAEVIRAAIVNYDKEERVEQGS
jgi:Arc/MetJ-type ribon-helix-helix transcriptional regulator